jgi:hypothetical protein
MEQGNFVGPQDAMDLSSQWLSSKKGCNFKALDKSTAKLTLSPQVIEILESFLRSPGNESGHMELRPLMEPKKSHKVIFDGSLAIDHPEYAFLPPTGHWSRFLTKQLTNEKKICRTFSFSTKSPNISMPTGNYIIFIFEVRLEGLRKQISLLGIPINTEDKSVIELDYETLPRIISRIEETSRLDIAPDLEIEDLLDKVRDRLDLLLEERREKASLDSEYRTNSKIAALRRTSEIRTQRLEQQIQNHRDSRILLGQKPDETYLRLTQARVAKEEARLQRKIEDLETSKEVTIDHSLEAIMHVRIVEER